MERVRTVHCEVRSSQGALRAATLVLCLGGLVVAAPKFPGKGAADSAALKTEARPGSAASSRPDTVSAASLGAVSPSLTPADSARTRPADSTAKSQTASSSPGSPDSSALSSSAGPDSTKAPAKQLAPKTQKLTMVKRRFKYGEQVAMAVVMMLFAAIFMTTTGNFNPD